MEEIKLFKDKLVVVVKNRGKVMREHGDEILLPFGSEYSMSFKNLESRNAVAKVYIDGEDVLRGHSLILKPGIEFPLERFFNGNLNNGNRFKFIEKTEEISNFRGDKIDDGLIRVEFWFEKEIEYYHNNTLEFGNFWSRNIKSCCTYNAPGISSKICDNSINYSCAVDDGITVKGSESDQSFTYGMVGVLEDSSHVMVFKLKGYTSYNRNNKIKKPITVKTRLQCETCGRISRSNIKYCPNCGTYLL